MKLIESLVSHAQVRLPWRVRLLYDKAADSEPLRRRFSWKGIRLIAPHRRGRDLSAINRWHYTHRWKVERTFSWLKRLRRLATRWEYHAHLFHGICQLGCLFIILKGF